MNKLTRIFSNVWWQITSVAILAVVISLAIFNVRSRDETIVELRQENYRLVTALEHALNRNNLDVPRAAPAKMRAVKH
jgi:hypothetical protein